MSEALDATEQESVLIQESDRLLHTIIDLSESAGVPSNFISNMPRIAQMPAASHPTPVKRLSWGRGEWRERL